MKKNKYYWIIDKNLPCLHYGIDYYRVYIEDVRIKDYDGMLDQLWANILKLIDDGIIINEKK